MSRSKLVILSLLCGIVITVDKQYLVVSRLEPILERNRLPSYESLVQGLKQSNSLAAY